MLGLIFLNRYDAEVNVGLDVRLVTSWRAIRVTKKVAADVA